MALREAVNEEDFGPVRIAPVLCGNGKAIGCLHRDRLELLLLRLARCHDGGEKSRDGNSGKMVPRGCVGHLEASLIADTRAARRGAMKQPLRCRAAVSIEIEGPPPVAQAPACLFLVGGARSCCLAGALFVWTLSTL